jgi:RNA polymerase sigma factor (sigma-70 family)
VTIRCHVDPAEELRLILVYQGGDNGAGAPDPEVDDDGLAPEPVPPPPPRRTKPAKDSPTDPAPRRKLTYREIAGDAEADLIRRYQAGDQQAGAMLLEAHEGIIATYALRSRGRGLDDEDLMQEGRIAFLHGVMKFDPSLGFKLNTYIKQWVWQASYRAVNDTGHTVYVPIRVSERIRKAQRKGLDTPEEIAEAGLLTKDQAAGALAVSGVAHLDKPMGEDGDSTMLDLIVSHDPDPEASYEQAERHQHAKETTDSLLACLTEKERTIILARIGAADGDEETLSALGAQFELSRERIRQLEVRAMRKLRTLAQIRNGDLPDPDLQDEDAALSEAEDDEDEDAAEIDVDEHVPEAPPEAATQATPPKTTPSPTLAQRLRNVRLPDDRSWYDVVEQVAKEHGVSSVDVASRARFKPYARARAHVWWWLRNEAGASYTVEFIAHVWGFSLPTVMHWIARHEARAARTQAPVTPPSRVSVVQGASRVDAFAY